MIGHGYQVIAADGVLGTSGHALTVYGINIISDGTAGVVLLRNGATVGSTAVIQLTGTANTGVYIDFGTGIVFPSGCFVDVDAHVTPSCTVVYENI